MRYCRFEQETPITSAIPSLRFDGDYVAGPDLMKVGSWRIHDNTFRNIRGRNGDGRAAVFLWNGCADVTVERNVVVGCDRAISLGNPAGPASEVDGGVIGDNLIAAGVGTSIEVCHAKAVSIVHNTVYSANPGFARTLSFLGNGAGNQLRNNLVLGRLMVEGGPSRTRRATASSGPRAELPPGSASANFSHGDHRSYTGPPRTYPIVDHRSAKIRRAWSLRSAQSNRSTACRRAASPMRRSRSRSASRSETSAASS